MFLIGQGPTQLPANQSGELAVCINDDIAGAYGAGLTDNQGQVEILAYPSNTKPNLDNPIISEPMQASPSSGSFKPWALQNLIGTWSNKVVDTDGLPYSYNVMPLPQVDPSSPSGYILKTLPTMKNSLFLRFTATHQTVAVSALQACNVLFFMNKGFTLLKGQTKTP